MLNSVKTSAVALAAAGAILLGSHQASALPFLGEEIETLSQFGSGPVDTSIDTVGPGTEISNEFSWMIAGDFINFTENAIIINFDGAHDFGTADDLHFEWTLTSGNNWVVGATAIVKAINVNLMSGGINGSTLSLDIFDVENANEFGGLIEIRVAEIGEGSEEGPVVQVPAPAALPLLAVGMIAMGWMRRHIAA